MKKISVLFIVLCVLVSVFATACQPKKPSTPATPTFDYNAAATQALQDMLDTWWTGDAATGNIVKTGWGYPTAPYDNMIWASAMMSFDLFTMWDIAPSDDIKARVQAQYNWTREYVPGRTANFGRAPHIAVDDCGWSAMYYMETYRITGDTRARDDALKLINGTYDYFKDGDTVNGLWYPSVATGQNYKSIYATGIVTASLMFLLDAQKSDPNWQTTYAELYQNALNTYNWMEANMLRGGNYSVTSQHGAVTQYNCADNLYWCDYNVNRPGVGEKTGPDGGTNAGGITESQSVSALLGNQGMAVCHALFYQLTGDATYRDRAVRTAAAITDSHFYNRNGVLLNDRDGWSDATYFSFYIRDVLTLPGIRDTDKQIMLTTAQSAAQNCRVQTDGKWYYKAEWSGGTAWEDNGIQNNGKPVGTRPEQIMTSADTANAIIAGQLLASMQAAGTI
ncbi:MAG: glycoside hydrolase family 76 protein [Oscillospiraceae bacterium]|nr:glycoside hydrolase family 76 protein [Oscillospiraceae bacterium]